MARILLVVLVALGVVAQSFAVPMLHTGTEDADSGFNQQSLMEMITGSKPRTSIKRPPLPGKKAVVVDIQPSDSSGANSVDSNRPVSVLDSYKYFANFDFDRFYKRMVVEDVVNSYVSDDTNFLSDRNICRLFQISESTLSLMRSAASRTKFAFSPGMSTDDCVRHRSATLSTLNAISGLQSYVGPVFNSLEYNQTSYFIKRVAAHLVYSEKPFVFSLGVENKYEARLLADLAHRTFSSQLSPIYEGYLASVGVLKQDKVLEVISGNVALQNLINATPHDLANNQAFLDWAIRRLEQNAIISFEDLTVTLFIKSHFKTAPVFKGWTHTCIPIEHINFEAFSNRESSQSLKSFFNVPDPSCLLSSRVIHHDIGRSNSKCIPVMFYMNHANNVGIFSFDAGHQLHDIATCDMELQFRSLGSVLIENELVLVLGQKQ